MEVDLSRDEDSVTSLAVAQSNDTSATAFAGINSSTVEQQAGRNAHLRSFKLGFPLKKRKESLSVEVEDARLTPETKALGRASLFTSSSAAKKETYQRVLRLSRATDGIAKFGVIATGLAPVGEIVVFDASKDSPGPGDVRGRIQLGEKEEAADVDIIETENGGYRVVYCTDYEVYSYDMPPSSNKTNTIEPQFLHGIPFPDVFSKSKKRPTFRSLRFLTPSLVLLVQNKIDRTGAELFLLNISSSGKVGSIVLRKRLHKAIKSATATATVLLPSPTSKQNMQHVIAIAGQDISITILTLEHPHSRNASTQLKFRMHTFLRNVHPLQMTALSFSNFILPSDASVATPQYLKLASISIANTVIVHTLPLSPFPPPSRNQTSPSRYILTNPGRSEAAQTGFSVVVSIVVVAFAALLLQAFTEIRGGTPEYLGAKGWLNERVHSYIARPYMFENVSIDIPLIPTRLPRIEEVREKIPTTEEIKEHIPTAEDLKESVDNFSQKLSLRAILAHLHSSSPDDHIPLLDLRSKSIMVRSSNPTPNPNPDSKDDPNRETSLSTELYASHEDLAQQGKKWEDLHETEKKRWRRRLIEAGEWSLSEGEVVLKGIFFSEYAGAVGGLVRG